MPGPQPIACRLDRLSAGERIRERELLAAARQAFGPMVETDSGQRVTVPDGFLPELGEFLALERKCCPFLRFTLEVGASDGEILLEISGGPGVKEFVALTFGREP